MLELKSVVIESRKIIECVQAGDLRNLVASEEVNSKEESKMGTTLVGTENILVVEEVGSEENQKALEIDHLGELNIGNQSRGGVRICHSFSLIFNLL